MLPLYPSGPEPVVVEKVIAVFEIEYFRIGVIELVTIVTVQEGVFFQAEAKVTTRVDVAQAIVIVPLLSFPIRIGEAGKAPVRVGMVVVAY